MTYEKGITFSYVPYTKEAILIYMMILFVSSGQVYNHMLHLDEASPPWLETATYRCY